MLRIAILVMLSFLLNGCSSPAWDSTQPPLDTTLRQWSPSTAPDAVVLGLHSFGDYGAAFELLGPHVAQAGIYLESYDQAGFGARQIDGRWAGEQQLVEDAVARIQQLSSVYHQPVFVMGESLGGAVAILAALKQPDQVAGIILSAPAVREGIRMRYGWNAAIATAATLAPGYRVSVERNPHDPLLAPTHAQRLALDDKVMREVRLDSYWGLIKLADRASDQAPALTDTHIPILLLYGERDSTVPEAGILALRRHLHGQLTYQSVADAPHLILQGQHWQNTADRILHWLAQHSPTSSMQDKTPVRPTARSAARTIGPPGQLHPRPD